MVLGLSVAGAAAYVLARAALAPDVPDWEPLIVVGGVAAACAAYHARRARGAAGRVGEASVRAGDAGFRAVFDQAAVGIALVDLDGVVLETNPAFQRFLGYSADELRGRASRDLSPPEDAAVTREPVRELKAGARASATVEKRYVRKDGEVVWGSLTISRVDDTGGTPAIVGMVQDITARKRAEDALRASEERYRLLLEHSPEAIVLHREGRILYVNAASTALAGGAHARDLIGRHVRELVHPDGHPVVEQQLAALAGGMLQTEITEYRLTRLDGRTIEVEAMSVPVVYDGRPAVQTVIRDGTARHEAEQAVRDSETRLRLALDAARMVAWELALGAGDREGGCCDALLAVVHPDDRERVAAAGARAVAERGELEIEFRVLGADGHVGWRHSKGRVLTDAEGAPIRMVGVSMDVDDRKELETQLRHAQKMEAVGRLAGGIAHDFNNMLTVIKSYGQLLLADMPSSAPQRDDVDQIIAAADRAARLTRQLLAFSRKQLLHPARLDPAAVVAGVVPMLQRLIGANVRLVTRLSRAVGAVEADPNQLEQVLVNLAVNARDAMPQGGRLTIETADVECGAGSPTDHHSAGDAMPPGSWVLLAVSDTGCGMDEATQARIFEPFFTTKGTGGTGLGLSTVYGIVEQSGGHVRVTSAVGRGTTFRVYLPRVEAAAGAG